MRKKITNLTKALFLMVLLFFTVSLSFADGAPRGGTSMTENSRLCFRGQDVDVKSIVMSHYEAFVEADKLSFEDGGAEVKYSDAPKITYDQSALLGVKVVGDRLVYSASSSEFQYAPCVLGFEVEYSRELSFNFGDTTTWGGREPGVKPTDDTCTQAYWSWFFFERFAIQGGQSVKLFETSVTVKGVLKGVIAIEKAFNPNASLAILGATCFVDTVSLSVSDMFRYGRCVWTCPPGLTSLNGVTGSSIAMRKDSGDALVYTVGLSTSDCANTTQKASIVIGQRTPKPSILTDTCVGTSVNTLTASVANPNADLKYLWTFTDNSQNSQIVNNATRATFNVGANLSGIVKLMATGGCDSAFTQMAINRKIEDNIIVQHSMESNPNCIFDGEEVTFYLVPTLQEDVTWVAPTSWIKLDVGQGSSSQTFRVHKSETGQQEIVSARASVCGGVLFDTISINENIGNVSIAESPEGVAPGESFTFKATQNPAVQEYAWTIPRWNMDGYGLVFQGVAPADASQAVTVILTVSYCGKEVKDSVEVCIKPKKPVFTIEDASCINLGTRTENITFAVAPQAEVEEFVWTIPSTWTIVGDSTGSSIRVAANEPLSAIGGVRNVSVQAKNKECGVSEKCVSADIVCLGADEGKVSINSTYVDVDLDGDGEDDSLLVLFFADSTGEIADLDTLTKCSYTTPSPFSPTVEHPVFVPYDYYPDGDFTTVGTLTNSNGCKTVDTYYVPATKPSTSKKSSFFNRFQRSGLRNLLKTEKSKTKSVEASNSSAALTKLGTLTLYPNPAKTQLTLNIEKFEESEVDVFIVNMQGHVFFRTNTADSKLELDISNYPRGAYLVRCQNTRLGIGASAKLILE